MPARTLIVTLLACISLNGCSQNRGRGLPAQNLNLVTREQITENHFVNAYEAVEAMRSNWLEPHGTDSFRTPSEVIVYHDNVKLGGTDALRGIPAMTIAFIHYFDGLEATNRWGVGHAAGVIQVSSFEHRR